MKNAKHIIIVFALMAVVPASALGQVQVIAQVDTSNDIYVGESFTYHVIVDGENTPGEVDLGPLEKYNPQSAGHRDLSQTSISIINNKTTKNVVKRYVMSYSLTADQSGQIEIPSLKVTLDGRIYTTNPVVVNILKPGTTDKLELTVEFSEKQCYVGQPILITIKFYVLADVGDFQFNIPALDSDIFHIEDPDVSDKDAKAYRLAMGIPALVSQHRVRHRGEDCILVTFSKILIPKRTGKILFDAATVSADVAVGRSRSRDRFSFFNSRKEYKRFMVSAEPMELVVLPLPEHDKPAEFYGLVGRYTISASATPVKDVYVGDPVTLTVKIGGGKYLKPVQWPALEKVAQLADNFKIPTQKASPTIENGFKVFTQTIRPDNNGANVIPAIPLAYFDPDSGDYSVAETEPIELDLKPSKQLTTADMQGVDFKVVGKEVEAIKKGFAANYDGLDALENMDFSVASAWLSPGFMTIWALPLAALILSLSIKLVTHTSPERIAIKRRRQAPGRAIGQLKKIHSTQAHRQHELLASTLKQYIGERFDRIAGALTADDCREVITSATQDDRLAESFRETIADCEAVRFASAQTNIDEAKNVEIIKLIKDIEKKSVK